MITQGGELEGIHIRTNGKPIGVIRIKGSGLADLEKDYRSGKALVEPLRLRDVLNYLRDSLFQALQKHEGRSRHDKARAYRRHQNVH